MTNAAVLDKVYSCLADETRRGILMRLTKRNYTLGELAEPYEMSLPAISKHIKILESAHLISRSVQGRRHIIALNTAPLQSAEQFMAELQRFWTDNLNNLEIFLKEKEAH
ncbi:MAG TPA: metalloregulator ArsR/SmtB family transcription factor [Acidimicrobiia bacterium]|nr:metalloregulator ArsR/SmtB family transcription factor [Acidimicrobiia bacterium]